MIKLLLTYAEIFCKLLVGKITCSKNNYNPLFKIGYAGVEIRFRHKLESVLRWARRLGWYYLLRQFALEGFQEFVEGHHRFLLLCIEMQVRLKPLGSHIDLHDVDMRFRCIENGVRRIRELPM